MLATWVDWVFVAALALAVGAGFVRGLVREALGLASWIVALLAARMFSEPVADLLGNWIESPDGRLIVAFVLIIIVTILVGGILIRMVQAAVEWVGAGFLNRLTGAVFGGVKATAVLTLVTLLIGFTPLDQLKAWQDASVRPHFEQLRDWGLGQLSDFDGRLPDFPESLRELPQPDMQTPSQGQSQGHSQGQSPVPSSPSSGGEAEGPAIDDASRANGTAL
ncbi:MULTISPECIES: CvpA family protein [Halomonas]|uniref:CvpA family protein n=1 Tax=Halomonas TaxID=2745 RepID=UPI001C93ADE2|nr:MULTISPECIES: CvpA family protein [Halomonas]MBY5968970.1 CvpA family protein [Halomonas denitrificans]MBY6030523.1 CvpA family protein [Halomonas sp. DP8Y7-1]